MSPAHAARRPALTPPGPDGMMPPREGPPMERRRDRVSRRAFVVGTASLGLVAGCGRLPWQAQPPARVLRIGYLITLPGESTLPPPPGTSPALDALRRGLSDYGYVEGQNLAIEYRTTDQGAERERELAAELAR